MWALSKSGLRGLLLGLSLAGAAFTADADERGLLSLEPGREYAGPVYQTLRMSQGAPENCRQICIDAGSRCSAFTYYRAGSKADEPVCRLLETPTGHQANADAVGGLFAPSRVSGDLREARVTDDADTRSMRGQRFAKRFSCPTATVSFRTEGDADGWQLSFGSLSGIGAFEHAVVDVDGFELGQHMRCYYQSSAFVYHEIPDSHPDCRPTDRGFICFQTGAAVEFSETVDVERGDSDGVDFARRVELDYHRYTDLWYITVDARGFLAPNEARLAGITSGEDGPAPGECAARLSSLNLEKVATAGLEVGQWFCYLTKRGQLGKFRIDSKIGDKDEPRAVRLTYSTWQENVSEPLLPIPMPETTRIQSMVGGGDMVGQVMGIEPDTETFNAPIYANRRVDWCLNFGSECGRAAAERFCREKDYRTAVDFGIAADVGRTKTLGDERACNDSGCDGFAFIKCGDPR